MCKFSYAHTYGGLPNNTRICPIPSDVFAQQHTRAKESVRSPSDMRHLRPACVTPGMRDQRLGCDLTMPLHPSVHAP